MTKAEIVLPANDLHAELAFFTERLGFRLEQIFPAEDPIVAVVSGHGLRLRLARNAETAPVLLRVVSDNPDEKQQKLTSPAGNRVEIHDAREPSREVAMQPSFQIHRLAGGEDWIIGRAGMHYRDLIPDRLGGGLIASHIRIPDGGPVPDMVHYHSIQFQMIYCLCGWVRLVYEDQGPPFILNAGDCVTQPPEIRHRVLEASDELEVIEIGLPAEHMTNIDHEMTLPTGRHDPGRVFEGQTFCHQIAATAAWEPWGPEGLMERDTGIKAASGGIADVRVLRLGDTIVQTAGPASDWVRFHYALTGEGVLEIEGRSGMPLSPGDVFVLPPGTDAGYRATTPTLELLLVAL